MSRSLQRFFDPGVSTGIEFTPLEVELRNKFGLEHVLMTVVHPLALPMWAQQIIGLEACRSARKVRCDVGGLVCNYQVGGPVDLREVGRLAALRQTGEVFVVVTRRREGTLAETLFWTDGGPVRLFFTLLKAGIAGGAVGILISAATLF